MKFKLIEVPKKCAVSRRLWHFSPVAEAHARLPEVLRNFRDFSAVRAMMRKGSNVTGALAIVVGGGSGSSLGIRHSNGLT